jgi:hypothetical protein
MFTWEVVTDFEGEVSNESLESSFARDFPEMQCRPAFWKMISFNAADGRRHRYLVAVPDAARESCERDSRGKQSRGRALPESIGLFALADKEIRSCDCGGNMRFAAVVDGVLYILVFMEGRLCHWSEENGYGGNSAALVEERLERFDTFLEKDPLFSRAESRAGRYADTFATRFVPDATFALFAVAARDPFWKGLDLFDVGSAGAKASLTPVRMLLLACIALPGAWEAAQLAAGDSNNVEAPGTAPELDAPPQAVPGEGAWVMKPAVVSAGIAGADIPNKNRAGIPHLNMNRAAMDRLTASPAPPCSPPAISIQGTIDGKLAQAREAGGEIRWLGIGDSVGAYAVASIGRDRVHLVCKSALLELLNGNHPGDAHALR